MRAACHNPPVSTPAPLAVQLYTFRAAAEHGLRPVLERVAAAGFLGVEYASLHGNEPRLVRDWVEDLGLTGVAAHRKLPADGAWSELFDEVSELGVDTLVVPWAEPDRFADLGSIRALADDLCQAQENAAAHGIALGYHNHWFELSSVIEGRTGLSHLFEATGPSVFAEVDVYWARVGGADPAALIAELGPRVRLLHIKDGPADATTSPHVAVGTGAIDIPAIVAASTAVGWHIVELDDCATDLFEAVERSADWLVDQGLSRGRA